MYFDRYFLRYGFLDGLDYLLGGYREEEDSMDSYPVTV